MAFAGTILAGIARVSFPGATGIVFYVMTSILNAMFCSLMSIGFVNNTYTNHNRNTHIRNKNDYYRYRRERNSLENSNMFFGIVNMIIFGVLALIGCFKIDYAFLPVAYLVIRLLYIWIRSRLFN